MKISEAKFVVIDTETTGLDTTEDTVVEISLVEVSKNGVIPLYDTLIDPQRDIPATASAIHHITERDVKGKPTLPEVWPTIVSLIEGAVLVAHNAQFDKAMLPETERPWICSLRLARHLWVDAPSYGNQVLRYWLGLEIDTEVAHRAAADTLVTAHVFMQELKYYRSQYPNSIQSLLELVYSPILVSHMPFGKHRGMHINEVPRDYLYWTLKNVQDLDQDLRWTIEQYLKSPNEKTL